MLSTILRLGGSLKLCKFINIALGCNLIKYIKRPYLASIPFSSEADVVHHLEQIKDNTTRNKIAEKIHMLTAGGGTCLGDGLNMGLDVSQGFQLLRDCWVNQTKSSSNGTLFL